MNKPRICCGLIADSSPSLHCVQRSSKEVGYNRLTRELAPIYMLPHSLSALSLNILNESVYHRSEEFR
jgi:hypothetical protein